MDDREDDENPGAPHSVIFGWSDTWRCVDIIQGMEANDLGEPMFRDPDALPPSNGFEYSMNVLYHLGQALSGGNFLFAVKAGILTGVQFFSRYMTSY